MNAFTQLLKQRKSVRVFEDRTIEDSIVEDILLSAIQAPTAGNQQLYTILKITDPSLLQTLAETCDHQGFIAQSKLALLFVADPYRYYKAYTHASCNPRPLGLGDLMIAIDDALIAATYATLAAESHGIGSCFIGDIMENCEIHKELLHLPDHVFPAAFVVFGYPTKQQKQRLKPPRTDLKDIVFENTYHDQSEAEIDQMLSVKCPHDDVKAWLRAFHQRKYDSDFAREMNRSVAAYLKNFMQE